MRHLVIIGNGITGVTTARHVRKLSDMKITLVSSETEYFFSRTALMYIYMGHMKFENTKPYEDWFWRKNKIDLVDDHVDSIDTDLKTLQLRSGKNLTYDKLVLATGSQSNKFGWPGQDLPGVQGLYSKPDLDLMEENTRQVKRAVIVGGGLIGIEVAEMLNTRGIPVTFLVRETNYWDNVLPREEAVMIGRHIRQHGVDLRLETNLKEIIAGDNGRASAVITDTGETIATEFVVLTPGVHPNLEAVKGTQIKTGRGVLVNDYLETNIEDVYAAGDCAEIVVKGEGQRNRLEQLWYTGRMQAETLARTICGERTFYERGIWFNSAKFFDIEYQTYGFVSNVPRDGEQSFYWEHSGGERCVRLVYKQNTRELVGMNTFGIRYRHEVFKQWLSEGKTVEYVLEHLRQANFDPEFYQKFEPEIIAHFNQETGQNLQNRAKKGLGHQLLA